MRFLFYLIESFVSYTCVGLALKVLCIYEVTP
jgi:hypothetical protein